jgi:hypothetical protein
VDQGLVTLGALLVISMISAATWHTIVKSYVLAIVASSISVGLITFVAYPMYRGVTADPLILLNAISIGAIIALGVGVPFKRRRSAKSGPPMTPNNAFESGRAKSGAPAQRER